MSQALTEVSIRALKPSDRYQTYWDSTPGFGVRVGKRSKTYIVVRGRARERISIGRFGDISLADARAEAKRLLATGPTPKTVRRTFKDARQEFVDDHFRARSPTTRYQVKSLLEKHCKGLDLLQLADIDDRDIKRSLDKLADRPSAQLHAYRYLRTFFAWAHRPPRRYIPHSPMDGYEAPGTDRRGTRVLTDDELCALWKAAGEQRFSIFRLLILWGTRNTETCCIARAWEVDHVLTIPGDVTKNGRDHSIPVLPLAEAALGAAWGNPTHVFAGKKGNGHLAPNSLNRFKREMMKASGTANWQIRDIRRTFRSNMARLGVPRDVCEVLINHAPPVLDDIYDRYDRLAEKRDALAKYEAFVHSLLAQAST